MNSIDSAWKFDHTIEAQDLSARMVGNVITFLYRMQPMNVLVQVIGELRQLSAGGGTVSVLVSSHDMDGGGSMAEFELEDTHRVTLMERA